MVALRAMIGDSLFQEIFRTYGRSWLNRHPSPYDFWNTFNYYTGRDLAWFWRTWWFETWTLDQSLASAVPDGSGLRVTVEDRGMAMMPVHLTIVRSDGRRERRDIPVDVWLSGSRRTTVLLDDAASIVSVEIDAENAFPDTDRSNNRWMAGRG
jgi:hypothetical protein